ncbi:MAG: hypothetical protein M1829_004582 [Trizodia sp. TS-e1964]|nr:MAG: hypothetical protein M1829_004582 [Trizodia sp. TS-e1964]
MDHYIGIDVGTGSARACVVDANGNIKGLASQNIELWQPQHGFYEQSTTNIWQAICVSVNKALIESSVERKSVRGIGFDATCSLAVLSLDTHQPISVSGPSFDNEHNIILWLDHRSTDEVNAINATKHSLLRYVGGKMSVEMEIPKILWLKNHMPAELFEKCQFYDLVDVLTYIATGSETRNFCSAVCKQGYLPVGIDRSVKGWQEDFLTDIGLGILAKDNFRRIGGVDGVNGRYAAAGELVGTLSPKAAGELGLPSGVAVGSGVIDAYAGWIGTVGAKVALPEQGLQPKGSTDDISEVFGRLAAVAGTSTCHLAMSPEAIFTKGVWGPYRDVLISGYWMSEGGQSATGELLNHVLQIHPAFQEATSLAMGAKKNIYKFLNCHLEALAENAKAPSVSWLGRHFFFYGDHFGNRSPIADANMSGSIIGLTADTSLDNLALHYYGAMEFIALQTRQIIETMNNSGHSIRSIFISGGQCQNDILMTLMASACQVPVVIPQYVTAAVVHGAAMLGARAASVDTQGKTEDLWPIMGRMSKPGKVARSTNDQVELKLLEVKYEIFLEQCKLQQTYRETVDRAIEGWKP